MTRTATGTATSLRSAVMSEIERLSASKHVLVTTFRRNGDGVPTPVWFARDGDSLVIFSVRDAGKVKRARRDPTVRLAPCDMRGRPTGPDVGGRAEILDDGQSAQIRDLIGRRYGIIGRASMLGSRIRRGRTGTIGLRLYPDEG